MSVRPARPADLDQIRRLFYETVTTVNTRDYTPEQIEVWSAGAHNQDGWASKISEQYFLVRCEGDEITGFGSLTDTGYLDFMYVHKDFQGRGIASEILAGLEHRARTLGLSTIWANVSLTARAFFTAKGFTVREVQVRQIREIDFQNTVMEKILD